jgi:hypothetical protein
MAGTPAGPPERVRNTNKSTGTKANKMRPGQKPFDNKTYYFSYVNNERDAAVDGTYPPLAEQRRQKTLCRICKLELSLTSIRPALFFC